MMLPEPIDHKSGEHRMIRRCQPLREHEPSRGIVSAWRIAADLIDVVRIAQDCEHPGLRLPARIAIVATNQNVMRRRSWRDLGDRGDLWQRRRLLGFFLLN